MHRNDDKFAVIADPSDPTFGTISDRWARILRRSVAADPGPLHVNDLESIFLAEQGFTGALNDSWFAYLGALGHAGTIADRWSAYWRQKAESSGYGDNMIAASDEFLVNRTADATGLQSEGGWSYEMDRSESPEFFTVDGAQNALRSDGADSWSWALAPDLESIDQWAEFTSLPPYGQDVGTTALAVLLRHTLGGNFSYIVHRSSIYISVRQYLNGSSPTMLRVNAEAGVPYRVEIYGTNPVNIRLRKQGGPWTTYEDSSADRITTGTRAGFMRRATNGPIAPGTGTPDLQMVSWGPREPILTQIV